MKQKVIVIPATMVQALVHAHKLVAKQVDKESATSTQIYAF